MRQYVVELDTEDADEYRELRILDTIHDRRPHDYSIDDQVALQREIMEIELYILMKYGDEDHMKGDWGIDPIQGVLYIDG